MEYLDDDEFEAVSAFLMIRNQTVTRRGRAVGGPAVDPHRLIDGRFWLQLRVWRRFARVGKWSDALGVSPATFACIVEEVRDELEHKTDHNSSRCIALEERVGIALFKLHNGVTNKVTEYTFRIAEKTTVGNLVLDFVSALVKRTAKWIYLPGDEELAQLTLEWERRPGSRLTNCVLAADGMHCAIATSDLSNRNYKKFDSFNNLAAVDCHYRLRYFLFPVRPARQVTVLHSLFGNPARFKVK